MQDTWLPMPRFKLRKDLVRSILTREAREGRTCLEFGYGSGDMLLLYAELGLTAYGFDIAENARRLAMERISRHARLKDRITLPATREELFSRRYDYIMAFEVLEHIEDDLACLCEWRDMLEDGGRLLLSVPAHQDKWGANDVASGHYRRYERAGLRDLLHRAGYRVLLFWNYGYPLSVLLDCFLHRSSREKERTRLTLEERSKRSGIERRNTPLNRLLSSDPVLYPFLGLQRLFLNRDWSSAFLVMASKTSPGES